MKNFLIKKIIIKLVILSVLFTAFFGVYVEGHEETQEQEVSVGLSVNYENIAELLFVDNEGNQVYPTIGFDEVDFQFEGIQESTGVLGEEDEILRIDNPTDAKELSLNIAPVIENSFQEDAYWVDGENKYAIHEEDINLSLDFANMEIGKTGECGVVNSHFEDVSFQNYESIEILDTSQGDTCRLDVEGIVLNQKIPVAQAIGDYSLDMVLTLLGPNMVDD